MPLRTATETLNTLYATTYKLRRKGTIDQVMLATPFWYLMNKKGRKIYETGGRSIEIEVQRDKNETVGSIGRGGSVNFQETDPDTVAEYQWRTITGHILRYRADVQRNAGPAARKKMVTRHLDNLIDSLIQEFSTQLFADGTGNGGLDFNGLRNLVADVPTTGTVGGINRVSEPWWRNQTANATGDTVSTVLLIRMRSMYNTCGRYGRKKRFPTQIVTTQLLYESYEAEIEEVARVYTGDKAMADLGFGELTFKRQPITWDPSCPDYKMYFLNQMHMGMTIDPRYELVQGDFLDINDQPDDHVSHNLTTGNLTIDRPRSCGIIYNLGN